MAHPAAIGETVNRAIWVALGTSTLISGAAAISIDTQAVGTSAALPHAQRAAARQAQRDGIEARYQADRARCEALAGARRDTCSIDAHAHKGRAMLEAAAPY
jgi:hypothetical protein